MNRLRIMDICLANLTCDNKFSIKNISAEVTFKPIDLYLVEKILVHIIWPFEKINVDIFFLFSNYSYQYRCGYTQFYLFFLQCYLLEWVQCCGYFLPFFQINDTRGMWMEKNNTCYIMRLWNGGVLHKQYYPWLHTLFLMLNKKLLYYNTCTSSLKTALESP